ncbi:MAG: GWxTD domain-containing protein [candidate division KSB1 bacterium]|nr:GWxTD domain-containing protein [candidate division KSB1 bacterium]
MKRSHIFGLSLIHLVLSLQLILANEDRLQQAERHYQQALNFYQQGHAKEAIRELQLAIGLNKKFARAYNQLALIYMDDGSVFGRFRASIELEKALRIEPRNTEFLFNHAQLNLQKGFQYAAEQDFKKIIKLNPNHYLAYYHLALLKEADMLHYKDMISIDKLSDAVISLTSFAHKDYEKAADYYRHAIALNPKFSDAYYRLAMLYYEFKNYEEMVQLLQSAVKILPEDKNCHLFLGFAYHSRNQYEQAATEYEIAKKLMNQSERELLTNLETILAPEQLQNYTQLSDSEKQQVRDLFWQTRDPFYLTSANERELEHFSRLAYANLRYTKREKNIEGWQTDRGKVLIRFGRPVKCYRTRPYIGEFQGNGRDPLNHSKEIWLYPNFHFVFEDRFLSDNFSFAWGDRPENDYKELYQDLINRLPEYYDFLPDSETFDVPVEVVAFQGQAGRTALEFCYALPLDRMAARRSRRISLRQGLFLFDSKWQPTLRQIRELSLATIPTDTLNQVCYLTQRQSAEIDPGKYFLALEFESQATNKRSRFHQYVAVDTFFTNRFQVSDLLFAKEVKPPQLNVPAARSDFHITPNPLHIYRRNEPIAIYYELYQLSRDERGETHYRIEYRVGEDPQARSNWRKMLMNMGLIKKTGEVTSSYDYTGNSITELQFLTLKLPHQLTGSIKFSLTATDLLTGATIKKDGKFTIIE